MSQNAISGKVTERAFFEKMEVKSRDFFKKWNRDWADCGGGAGHLRGRDGGRRAAGRRNNKPMRGRQRSK